MQFQVSALKTLRQLSTSSYSKYPNGAYGNYGNYAAHRSASESAGASSSSASIVRFDDEFVERVRAEFTREADSSSTRLQTFPRLAKLLKGFRTGELTVFTGPTGSGKTTALSQMSLDYCFQGIKTLWGSFEIRNTRLARVMIQQVAAKAIQSEDQPGTFNGELFRSAQQVLQRSPLFFMDYFGSTSLDAVMETMDRSIREHQVQHILLDNLQFMLSGQHSNSLDKFDLTDRTVSALRTFATTRNVHVTLVIHPRKEMDDTPLGLASVSGTAKATQEADNVIILQKVGNQRYIEVKKNRFDGTVGSVAIKFNTESRLLVEAGDVVPVQQPPVSSSGQ